MSPANTSHLLQPCDQLVNKAFKQACRRLRDDLLKQGTFDHRTVAFNLACGACGNERITTDEITKSFPKTYLYPFQPLFGHGYKSSQSSVAAEVAEIMGNMGSSPSAAAINIMKLQTDANILQEFRRILNTSSTPTNPLRHVQLLLRKTETVHNILSSLDQTPSSTITANIHIIRNTFRIMFKPTAPTEFLTLEENRC